MDATYTLFASLIFGVFHLHKAEDFCNGRPNGVHTFPEDVTKYVICAAGDTFMMKCSEGLVFDKVKLHCAYQENTSMNWGPVVEISSSGTKERPYCSWNEAPCVWNDESKAICADGICNAAGYEHGGSFVSATNNMCTTSLIDGSAWYFLYNSKKLVESSFGFEAGITANCRTNEMNSTNSTSSPSTTQTPTTTALISTRRHRHRHRHRGFCHGKMDGVYRFQDNCSKFITCANNDKFVTECPDHLLFDEEKKYCNYEWDITYLNCTQALRSDIVLGHADIGEWGSKFICPDNGYINGFRLKVEDETSGDNTAINGIEVSCTTGETGKSFEASRGSWRSWQKCSCAQHVWSFNFRSQKYSETEDNTGGNDVNMVCTDNVKLLGGGNRRGSWVCQGAYCSCSHRNATLCGIQTKGEEADYEGDDDAISIARINFICCQRH